MKEVISVLLMVGVIYIHATRDSMLVDLFLIGILGTFIAYELRWL